MNKKLSELEEKFIIYYETNNIAQIFSTPSGSITKDEFMKCDIPCKDCLVQSMCIIDQDNINNIDIKEGIKIQLCESLKKFIAKNQSIFNQITFQTTY